MAFCIGNENVLSLTYVLFSEYMGLVYNTSTKSTWMQGPRHKHEYFDNLLDLRKLLEKEALKVTNIYKHKIVDTQAFKTCWQLKI